MDTAFLALAALAVWIPAGLAAAHTVSAKPLRSMPRESVDSFVGRARDGDLVFTFHRKQMDTLIFNRMPTHVGMVWQHPTMGPCMAEIVPKVCRDPTIGIREGGMRVTPLHQYMSAPHRVCVVRRLHCSETLRPLLRASMASRAGGRPYYESMSPAAFTLIALTSVAPTVSSSVLDWMTAGDAKSEDHTICSRFVFDALADAGMVNRERLRSQGISVHALAPSLMLSGFGKLDECLMPGVTLGTELMITTA